MAVNEANILASLEIGIERPDAVNDAVIVAIQSASESAINVAREILLKKGTGSLAQSVIILPVKKEGSIYSFQIQCDDYGLFIDKGVNGTQQAFGSPYSFKHESPSRKHVQAILKWIPSAGLMLSPQHPQTKSYEQMAWAVATSVKRHGIKPTPFIDKAFGKEYEQSLSDSLSLAIGRAIDIKFEMIAMKHNSPVQKGAFK